jgi:hypothetical protein
MRTVTKLISLLLVLLMLTGCRSSESEEKITSRYVDTLSSVEGVAEVETEWWKGGGVAGTFMEVRIRTSTDDPVELERIQYRAWEEIMPTIDSQSRVRLDWRVVSANGSLVATPNELGFQFDTTNEGIFKRQWEDEGLREQYEGPK